MKDIKVVIYGEKAAGKTRMVEEAVIPWARENGFAVAVRRDGHAHYHGPQKDCPTIMVYEIIGKVEE